MSEYDPDSELYFLEERRNRNRDASENESAEDFDGLCPKCHNFYMQFQGSVQRGISGHWFEEWLCLACGYVEYG